MRLTALIAILALSLSAQVHPAQKKTVARTNADQLGLTCVEILQMSSADWVTKFAGEKGTDTPTTIRAIGVYGKCYDLRSDQVAATLGRTGKEPGASARANFQAMEQALKAFTAKALVNSQPPADAVKSAYAALYEKQFRYEFYQAYQPKPAPPVAAAAAAKQTSTVAGAPGAALSKQTSAAPAVGSAASGAATPAPAANGTGNSDRTASKASTPADLKASDADPLTQAKNHFGELLGKLPDDQMHELHGAFGEILGPNTASSRMQLLVYRYAIFLLEAPGDKPFSDPSF
jgi:hypothetical protein